MPREIGRKEKKKTLKEKKREKIKLNVKYKCHITQNTHTYI